LNPGTPTGLDPQSSAFDQAWRPPHKYNSIYNFVHQYINLSPKSIYMTYEYY